MHARYEVVNGDRRLVMIPRGHKHDGSTPMVIAGHGHSSAPAGPYITVPFPGYGWRAFLAYIEAGIPVCLIEAGGGKGWNSVASVDHMVSARDWMIEKYGCAPDPHVFGFSMGGMLASTFAGLHGARSLVLACPALSMVHIHDTNYSGYGAAELEAAYGGLAGYQAAVPQRDPLALAGAGEFDGIPIEVFHSAPGDNVAPLSALQQFATAVGAGIHYDSRGHNPDVTDPNVVAELL